MDHQQPAIEIMSDHIAWLAIIGELVDPVKKTINNDRKIPKITPRSL
jgi:hypothetical protein